ncbi:MAG: hypothetical protein H2034_01025 [Flavobacteriaceae bacterium]|nr:hypothetical protein [Flavobacteriaceae bacterium]
MKKNLLILVFLLIYNNLLYSQNEYAFQIENSEGTVIQDNETLNFNSVEYPDASFSFFVRNLTDETIFVRSQITSISGTDGSGMEFCFGECYFGVSENFSYPLASFVEIESGQIQTSVGDHFYNQDLGDGETPVEYTFRFYMVDSNGDEVVSVPELITSYLVNYSYSSSLSLTQINNINFDILYNSDVLNITSPINCKLEINDILGRKITDLDLNSGVNLFENINLKEKVVIFRFKFSDGSVSSKKFIF